MAESDLFALLQKTNKGHVFKGSSDGLVPKKERTDIEPLDALLAGGLPRARMTLMHGDSSSGKTFLCQKVISAFQKRGLSTVYVDVERCFDPWWFGKTGVDVDQLIVAQPPTGEDTVDLVTESLQAKADLVILDSAAFMLPGKVMEADAEKIFVGALARLLGPAISRWQASNTDSVFIMINQPRAVIGSMFNETRLPGGEAQRFAAALRLRVRRKGGWKTEADKRIGFDMAIQVEKTKIPGVTPWSDTIIPFRFDGSLDEMDAVVALAIDRGVVQKEGAHYTFNDNRFFGANRLRTFFTENVTQLAELMEILYQGQQWEGEQKAPELVLSDGFSLDSDGDDEAPDRVILDDI